jgi:hypothetical protein
VLSGSFKSPKGKEAVSEPIKTGLWWKEHNGNQNLSGSLKINGQEYWVNLYENTQKASEKSPDFSLYLKPKAGA